VRRGILILLIGLGLVAGCGRAPRPGPPDHGAFRGLWVTRWDYRTADDVDRIVADAAALGITDLLWQVRGQADAFYRSELEPWGQELLTDPPAPGDTTTAVLVRDDPGFDPLARAVAQAHRHGLRLHAWLNVYPLWKGLQPPLAPDHALHRHPAWRLRDDRDQPQPLNDHYVVANPTDPEVQAHIAAVVRDVVTRYEVDGVHRDYVRFVAETLAEDRLWPGDLATLARFQRDTGRHGVIDAADREAYRDWVRDQVTALVFRIASEARAVRTAIEISAAVIRDPVRAREVYLQDGPLWLRAGALDRALPMLYTDDVATFAREVAAWRQVVPAGRLSPGLGIYLQEPGDVAAQIDRCADTAGYALFAYASLFESANPLQDRTPEAAALRAGRLAVVRERLAAGGR